eukprot:TRINITY_DN1385_c2_g1_i1.p1 TRINITY_DN1385_c2_g1~~TRINITY_DN1385_c2_g1_i1.p1  ORF type:complete len:192 (+),score=22.89 TRINITY_DN1385_c2_g1_i1:25-576(+)
MHTHVAGSAFSSPPPRVRPSLLALFLAVCGWFSCSLAFNWSSKSLLNVLPRPVTATLVQLFSVMVYVACYSVVDRHSIAAPSRRLLRQMVPLGLVQLSTKLLHQLALSYVSVSSVHTVKVLTPIFTVVLSRVVLGERGATPTHSPHSLNHSLAHSHLLSCLHSLTHSYIHSHSLSHSLGVKRS